MRTREGYAVARDGAPIYYRVVGERGGLIPVVLTDGIGCDGYIWKYLEPALAERHLVVHWHYRGHGRTPVPRDRQRVSMSDMADDLESVMDATELERAAFAGHSMGVQVSLEAYRRHRARSAGLVLICGAYGNPLRTLGGHNVGEALLPYAAFAINHAPNFVHSVYRKIVPTELAFALAARLEINPNLVAMEDFMPYLEHLSQVDLGLFLEILSHAARHTTREVLPTVEVPTLIVAGEKDGMTPASLSEEMNRQIPGSQLLVVPDGSHTAPLERPQLVTDTIANFLSTIS